MLNAKDDIEELILYVKEFLTEDKPALLASSEFNRGKEAMLYELIDGLERLLASDDE